MTNMKRIAVDSPTGRYDICIGENLLQGSGRLLEACKLRPGPVAVVSNEIIAEHHSDRLCEGLKGAGYEPLLCIVPEGEAHKTLATIATLYDRFLTGGLDRKSPVLSLGGGVIGDMAGFAAATYLRGTPFVQIPTSLLAMVDASVGGKTGVDLPQGKNLVGAFKQPELVIIDIATLNTLPPAQFRAGLAEVIKHGIIADPQLFEGIEAHGPTSLAALVSDAVQVKVDVVQEDPFEQGRRAVLNLGHTFGHAIEWTSKLVLGHGEAVAVGIVAAAHLAASMGRCSGETVERIINILDKVELPTSVTGYPVDAIMDAMWYDKKRQGKNIRFIIPQAIGDVVIIDNPGNELVRAAVEKVVRYV
ncbi:MAG: 3-dehydroquinate synthase [Chloroflexota bacterium]